MKHRLWIECHYVMPIDYETDETDRAKAIAEAKDDFEGVTEALPRHTIRCDEIVDAWFDVADGSVDGIYERSAS